MKNTVTTSKEKKGATLQQLGDKIWIIRRSILSEIAPEYLSKKLYRHTFSRELDLENPVYFNEKLMWLKLKKYANDPLVIQCADKYLVRKYVEQCGLECILNDLIGAWDDAKKINWEHLPKRFVLKCNNGCGTNLICKDKDTFDRKKAVKRLNRWLKNGTWREYAEIHYKKIPPMIICEKYLEGVNGALPVDYKVYCFNGEPKYIGNFIERNIEEDSLVRGYFDMNWCPSKYYVDSDKMELAKFKKPEQLEKMLEYARILSKPFPFARVDFFEIDGKIVFGELTFTPTGCLGSYYSKEAYLELGEALDLSMYGK